jgi:hypothetical protein
MTPICPNPVRPTGSWPIFLIPTSVPSRRRFLSKADFEVLAAMLAEEDFKIIHSTETERER